MKEAVDEALAVALGTSITRTTRLAGGASKEAWAVHTDDGRELLLRRAGGGVIHLDTLSLRQEFDVLVAARHAGVRVPKPIAYLGDLDGREAFVMELVHGEAIGRRIVKAPPPGLDLQMAEELAKIHSIPPTTLPFLPSHDLWERLYAELDSVEEPHPAIELGIVWCRERLPLERPHVVTHGDFRLGNLMIDEKGRVHLANGHGYQKRTRCDYDTRVHGDGLVACASLRAVNLGKWFMEKNRYSVEVFKTLQE